MTNDALSNIANGNASNSIITPSTTISIEISMINATTPSIIINTGIYRCRSAATTITSTVVVTMTTITMIAINTIMIIITSTRLLLLLLLLAFFIHLSMSTNLMMTTIITSLIANVCVNSDRSSTTATIVVVMVSINIKFISNDCGSYQY